MDATYLILPAMLLVTPEEHRPAPGSARMATYEVIAEDIETAAHNPVGDLPFDGPLAVEATELALAAIGANESSYRDTVRDCRKKGDKGKSVSTFQLFEGPGRGGHTEKQICENPVLAGKLAINILGWYQFSWKTEQLFAGYATGRADTPNYASGRQHSIFQKMLKANNMKVSKQKGFKKLYAEPVSTEMVSSANATRPWTVSFASE